MNICDLGATIRSETVREAFSALVVGLGKSEGLWFEPDTLGTLSGMRIRRGADWCFSAAPVEDCLLFQIRQPELRRGTALSERVRRVFPAAAERVDGPITIRLRDAADVATVMGLLENCG